MLLGLDTATGAVCVAVGDGQVLVQRSQIDPRRQAEVLAPLIDEVLREAGVSAAQLTGIAVGVGPGPFTGLRVGVTTARVLGEALGVPVHGVCTLDVIAADVESDETFAVATDARRREVYWATYDDHGVRQSGPEVTAPADLPAQVRLGLVAGSGPGLYPEVFPQAIPPVYPSAATLIRIAAADLATGRIVEPQPLCLRRPDVTMPSQRKAVTP